MISLININKRYKKLQAIAGVTVTMQPGQVIALVGPNGSGKTTLIKIILGLVRPDSGTFYFNKIIIKKDDGYKCHIGYMPQLSRYPHNMRVGQLFNMIKNIRNSHNRHDEELYFKFKIDTILDKTMSSLSGGTRQKVSAALAFLFDTEVLILDEPTAGLDPLAAEILKSKIACENAKGKMVLITSHILSDLEELATDVMYMHDGRLLFYKPIADLRADTGQEKLSRAIAWLMNKNTHKTEISYLKIAK